jgi:hypothetical protein
MKNKKRVIAIWDPWEEQPKEDRTINRLIKTFILACMFVLLSYLLGACAAPIPATGTSGRVLETYKENYARVYFSSVKDKADYGAIFDIYIPGVQKKDSLRIVTHRYLDSLVRATHQTVHK